MDEHLKQLLRSYRDYTDLFAKQIYRSELWQEQTGCEVDEYFEYVSCCEGKLYNFQVWYEQTEGGEYPTGYDWDFYKNHKNSLLEAHP
jgi:hypothetical protein